MNILREMDGQLGGSGSFKGDSQYAIDEDLADLTASVHRARLSAEKLSSDAAILSVRLAAVDGSLAQQGRQLPDLNGALTSFSTGNWQAPSGQLARSSALPMQAQLMPHSWAQQPFQQSALPLRGSQAAQQSQLLQWTQFLAGQPQPQARMAGWTAPAAIAMQQQAQPWLQRSSQQFLSGQPQATTGRASLNPLASLVQFSASQHPTGSSTQKSAAVDGGSVDKHSDASCDAEGKPKCSGMNWFFTLNYMLPSIAAVFFWIVSCCCCVPLVGYSCFYLCAVA